MNCYNCGCRLSEKDFCTACGTDVGEFKHIIRVSNFYYNEGLEKAKVRDLSGAVTSLRQSLKFYKNNIDARNLLGLVYFEMGEAVTALGEWVISKNLRSKKNIADDYIQAIQSNPTKLDTINQTIKKYNQALAYCYQDSADLAVIQLKKVLSMNPKMIKGYQLLSLLHMHNEEWDRARRTLAKAQRIDTSNTLTLRYSQEAEKMLTDKDESVQIGKKKKPSQEEVITYQSGNETIIQPVNIKEGFALSALTNILIGLGVGLAIAWFLILPAKIQKEKAEINNDFINASDQLSAQKATATELEQRVTALQDENENMKKELEDLTGNEGAVKANDYLLEALNTYMENPSESVEIMESLSKIDKAYLNNTASPIFKDLYNTLNTEIKSKASQTYYDEGIAAYKAKDYKKAITELMKAVEVDETNVEALYQLGHAYRRSEDATKADETYNQVIELFPDSNRAQDAKQYISTAGADADTSDAAASGSNANSADNNTVTPPAATPPPAAPVIVPPAVVDPNLLPPGFGTIPGIDPITGLPIQ